MKKSIISKEKALQLASVELSHIRAVVNLSALVNITSCFGFILFYSAADVSSLIVKTFIFCGSLLLNILFLTIYKKHMKNIFQIESLINSKPSTKKPKMLFSITSAVGYVANIFFIAHTLVKFRR